MNNNQPSNPQTGKEIELKLEDEEWYQALVEELKATVVETVFISRTEIIKGKWLVGEAIETEVKNFTRAKIYGRKIDEAIARSLECSEREIRRSRLFYKWTVKKIRKAGHKDPIDWDTVCPNLPEGKNISWHKIANKYLPQPKEDKQTWLRYTDVWNFAGCDERFGTKDFSGRIPGQIVQNILYYWIEEESLIIDPMAGGGTTIDVCRDMNRTCIAFDIKPVREDIIQHDATKEWPISEKVNLIFIDPPYWSQQEEAYGGISRLSYENYLKEMELIFEQAYKSLKGKGVLAVLIAPMAIKTEYKDIPIDFTMMLRKKFNLIRRIAVPVSSQQVGPQIMGACKRNRELVAINRDLLIFKKKPKASQQGNTRFSEFSIES